jgi:hypothetical protein
MLGMNGQVWRRLPTGVAYTCLEVIRVSRLRRGLNVVRRAVPARENRVTLPISVQVPDGDRVEYAIVFLRSKSRQSRRC